MSNTQRPSLAPKHTPASEKNRSDGMDRGIAYTEEDGTRLVVMLGDIRGSHEAKLVSAIGTDFVGLLERMMLRQGSDLLAAVVWFCRLVNNRPNVGTYEDTLDEVGYAQYLQVTDPAEPIEPSEADLPQP